MPNALKLGSRVTRTRANNGITTGAIAVLPCHQANTDTVLTDISGSGLGSTAAGGGFVPATHFAGTDGVITPDMSGSTDFAQRILAVNFNYDFNSGDAFLAFGRIKVTTALPASTKPIFAQGGANTAAQGLRLSLLTAGGLTMVWDGPSTQQFGAATDTVIGAAQWYSWMFASWNHVPAAGTLTYGIWINGVRAYTTFPKSGSSLTTTMTPTESVRIGAYHRISGPVDNSIGATHANVHFYRAPAAVPQTTAKMDALALRLHRDPFHPLSLAEWPMV